MKLTLLLLLVFASVALLRAEETVEDVEEQEQPSMNDLLDGSLDDEVLGNEEDPGHHRRHKARLRRLGDKIYCAKYFYGCLRKTRYRCKLVPVCAVHFYACRCIIKVARQCIGFLKWLRRVIRKHKRRHGKRHDELDEDEDARRRRGYPRHCKRGYRRCARGKKYCRGCLRSFGLCLKKHYIKRFCAKHGHHDEEEDEEVMVANAIQSDESEVAEDEEVENDPLRKRRRRLSWAQKRCLKYGLKCMLRARLNCRRQGRCVRRTLRCLRRVRRRRRRRAHAKKQAKKQAKKHDE